MQNQDLIGHQLGNYRLTTLLGKGGFAKVYLGEHIFLGSQAKAAIKVLDETQLSDEDRQNFLTEARTIRKLNHPQIVKLLEFGIEVSRYVDASIPYLVMDYAPNGTLRNRHPRNTVVPLAQLVSYVNQVADGLQYAHEQGVVHRDVKPENMLVMGSNEIVLSDFGIAVTSHDSKNLAHTKDGVLRGTFAYIAPERLAGTTRRASDQYSLAVVVYEWLTGVQPFRGNTEQVIYSQIHTPPPPLYGTYPHISQEIEAVVMRALAKDPEQRYPSMKDFAQALNAAVQSVARSSMQSAPQQAYSERPEQKVDLGYVEKRTWPVEQQPPPEIIRERVDSDEYRGRYTPPIGPQAPSEAARARVDSDEYRERHTPPIGPRVSPEAVKEKADAEEYAEHTQPAVRHPYGRQQQAAPEERTQPASLSKEHTIYSRPQANPGRQDYAERPQADVRDRMQGQQADVNGQYQAPVGQQRQHIDMDYQTWQQIQSIGSKKTRRPVESVNPVRQETLPVRQPKKDSFGETLRRWFELDHDFARLPKNRTFRNVGMLLNALAAVLVGLLAQPPSGWLLFGGVLYSLVLFNLCIRFVNVKLSIAAGLLVALFWGYASLVVWNGIYLNGPFIPKISPFLIAFLPPLLVALFFFSASAYLHIRYAMDRLP